MKVLVAYASRYGATEEIAMVIGQALYDAGLEVDVRDVRTVEGPEGYTAVVLGSAVYAGQWQESAAKFLQKHAAELAKRPVWLFSSGPTGEGDAVELMKGWNFPENLRETAERIHPQEIVFFHGYLNLERMNLAERMLIKAMRAPTGDFRDWEQIVAWGQKVAAALRVTI